MTPSLKVSIAAGAFASAFAFVGQANAQAFYLQEQSARGAGRAFSGEVADTGAASLWWNPAAIADADRIEGTLSASAILPRGEVVDRGTVIVRPAQAPGPVGGDAVSRNPINNGVLPSGAFAAPLARGIVFGLAVTSPYSFTTDYSNSSWARYSADRTRLRTVDIQPSLAVALTDWLRVGGAVNVEYTDASLSNKLPNLSAALPDGEQKLSGNGWNVGWTAGLQMHNDFATVGIAYKSAIKHDLKGDLAVSGLLGRSPGRTCRSRASSELLHPGAGHRRRPLPRHQGADAQRAGGALYLEQVRRDRARRAAQHRDPGKLPR